MAARQASLSITNSCSLLKLMSIKLVMPSKPSNHLILCHPLFLLPSIFPSIKVFFNEWALCIRWPKYWNFSIGPSNEYSGLISLRIDWLDLLAVHRTLKSLLQHHSSKLSILRRSAFFIAQLSHPHVTTGKTISLTRRTLLTKQCLFFLICQIDCNLLKAALDRKRWPNIPRTETYTLGEAPPRKARKKTCKKETAFLLGS